jgi:hypothetical protein
MLELLQITNDPALAERCDAVGGFRLFVDLERHGKAERQAGRNTFISTHELADVSRIKRVLKKSRLMVRLNPLHAASSTEIASVIEAGADTLMLPMFEEALALQKFCALVAGRLPVVALLETRGALETLDEWIATPGLEEVYVGLNDLHVSLGLKFMFEPLALGHVERVAVAARQHGIRFGFGGIARLTEGKLPGRAVLAEHVRLGSRSVILSRTFHRSDSGTSLEDEVHALRRAEFELGQRDEQQALAESLSIRSAIAQIVDSLVDTNAPGPAVS